MSLVLCLLSHAEDDAMHDELTNLILNEYRMVHAPPLSIDRFVEGDLSRFADHASGLPLLQEVWESFEDSEQYIYHHILDGMTHERDEGYCGWVATGLMRLIGRNPVPPPIMFDQIFANLGQIIEGQWGNNFQWEEVEEGEIPPPLEEGEIPPPLEEGEIPPPLEEGEIPPPLEEGEIPPPLEDENDDVPPLVNEVYDPDASTG